MSVINVKKIVDKTNKTSPNTGLTFSNIIFQKDLKNLEKTQADINSPLKHLCWQKKFNLISNDNIKEEDLGIDIPAQILSHDFPSAESFFVEMILHKKKWLVNCSCNPNKNNIKNRLETITKALDAFFAKYKNIRLLGDFNVCVDDETMINFCNSYSLNSLIKQSTCFKDPENPSCIDLILTKPIMVKVV